MITSDGSPTSPADLQQQIMALVQRHAGRIERCVLIDTVSTWLPAPRAEVEAAYRRLTETGMLVELSPGFWAQVVAAIERRKIYVQVRAN